MSATPAREVTSTQVAGITFGFYSDDEIRQLSVKQITSPIVFDNFKNPVAGGLYDPALGPVDQSGRCATCKLGYMQCPGHFGHLELAVPVYNPLVFPTLYKLLKCTCLHCFRLKMLDAEAQKYRRRLELLAQGRLVEAMQVQTGGSSATAKAVEGMQDAGEPMLLDGEEGDTGRQAALQARDAVLADGSAALQARQASHAAASSSGGQPRAERLTSLTIEAVRDTVTAFFGGMPKSCANCGAELPVIRRDGCLKLFQKPLDAKKVLKNSSKGIDIASALTSTSNNQVEVMEAEMAQELQREAEARNAVQEVISTGAEAVQTISPSLVLDEAAGKTGGGEGQRPRYMTVSEVREIMRRMWSQNSAVLRLLFAQDAQLSVLGPVHARPPKARGFEQAFHMFFLQVIPVAPNRVRPVSMLGDQSFEHPHNIALTRIINANLDLVSRSAAPAAEAEALEENKQIVRQLDLAASLRTWLALQGHVNSLLDSTTSAQADVAGIRQQLEKKEGLFRKNMMGKRVNFAARSVISPDPYLAAGEIGVPPYFATRLSYPERVTPWNVQELREMVIRGPHEHPGAVAVEDENGRTVQLQKLSREKREGVAKLLLAKQGGVTAQASRRQSKPEAPARHGAGKIVYRHLRDGDLMLTNRQPTLHRPGLMAHRARVLKGERVIRMHYANCATFNADFDGDEINLHLPQDHLGRAEGYGIVHADEQYIVPTDGKPVRGLIQDHVVAGVKLTKHDTFMPRSEFMQLVYACCSPARPGLTDQADLLVPPPSIWKPEPLWTGKQVITTVLAHFTRGMPPLTLSADAKVPGKHWSKGGMVTTKRRGKRLTLTFPESNEGHMIVHKGELLSGILDKAVFGKFGLVHAVQDLYGNAVAGSFISALSRLLTFYLQMHGFTCGFDDLLLVPEAEAQRRVMLETAETAALHASARFVGEAVPQLLQGGQESGSPLRQSLVPADAWSQARSEVQQALAVRYRTSKDAGPKHDAIATGVMHPLSSEVVKVCLPDGQAKPFPMNCLGLMTTSGAKGSNVNFSQISALLGQQELEGRRVPRMASGKTLPCFQPFDPGARSGGFVGDRFLTGLRPQEYYFHCMAGREGLVDTTVKTSRSGYLQRCLVKNLEPLRVHYDHTVRDDCDGSVVQFAYGEDGLDVTKKSFMKEFGFLARNAERFAQQVDLAGAKRSSDISGLSPLEAAAQKRNRQRQRRLAKGQTEKADGVAPVSADFPITALGVTSEAFQDSLRKYVCTNPDMALDTTVAVNKKRKQEVGQRAPELLPRGPEGFSELMDLKFLQGLAAPGEAVGVLAAQSVGEPSTQMTLNTFHMAGRGEANVTLGIPRLRELLMTAAKSIRTPVMTLPLLPHCTRTDAETLANRLRRLRLAEVTEEIEVEETYIMDAHGVPCREYCIRMRLTDPALYPPDAGITFEQVVEAFNTQFRLRLIAALKKELKRLTGSPEGMASISTARLGEEEGVTRTLAEGADEGGRATRKSEKEEEDENAEVDNENQEGKLAWAGGRKEEATYEAGDAEDKAIAAAAQKAAQQEDLGPDEEEDGVDGAGALVPSQGDEGEEEQPLSRPGKQAKGADAAMQTSTSVDEESHACEARVGIGLGSPKLLMLKLVEQVAAETVVKATPGIDRCYVVEKKKDEPGPEFRVQTDGISFEGAFMNNDLVNVNQVTCNDVGAVLRTFGVEAARRTIVAEVGGVFGAYGIGVDPRHLSLISDHMTRQGGYRAMNRMGIEASASPFLKVTFETAATFLMDATLKGQKDDLASPASRIVAGRVVDVGTGCMELIQQLKLEE